ncbi:MAG: arsenate reductase (glutaredoxin) [Saprospiraceae bacterium]|nr:arsenate reductase (glutaredoxin) [Saprospiraceae bacterium]
MLTIYHNNRCGKSRAAKNMLDASGQPFEVVDYLLYPPSEKELAHLLDMLGMKPLELIRSKEAVFQEQFKGKNLSDAEWIRVMVENPVLIERPIVVMDDQAWVVRSEDAAAALNGMLCDMK